MDSTPPSPPPPPPPPPHPSSSNPPIQANPISSIPSSRKLPIKRKNPNNSNSTFILTLPNPQSQDDHYVTTNPPPFKFHRVWSEPDEIRLLQGLLDSSSQGLSFPRDLGIFYNQFSTGMSQPYSKSQLSEKLRRLRKKFRVMASRLSKGLEKSQLSPQDRALYDLSKQLWDPDPAQAHPSVGGSGSVDYETVDDDDDDNNNNNNNNKWKSDSVNFSLPSTSTAVLALPSVVKKSENNGEKVNKVDDGNVEVKLGLNEVKVKKSFGDDLRSGIVRFATTSFGDVVEKSLKEMRMMIDVKRFEKVEKEGFERRWRDQYVEEFDVLVKRLKLILEDSLMLGK